MKNCFILKATRQVESHRYYNQITLDVVRTLKRFPPRKYSFFSIIDFVNSFLSSIYTEISSDLREKLQKQLIDIICKILIKNKNHSLHYYQVNFEDINKQH